MSAPLPLLLTRFPSRLGGGENASGGGDFGGSSDFGGGGGSGGSMTLGPLGCWGGQPWSLSAAGFGVVAAAGFGLALPALLRWADRALAGRRDTTDSEGLFSWILAAHGQRIRWGSMGAVLLLQMMGMLPLLVFFAGIAGAAAWLVGQGVERLDIRSGPLYEFRRWYVPLFHGVSAPPPESRTGSRATAAVAPADFEPGPFLARVAAGWERLQDAWCAQDLGPVASLTTDGLAAKLDAQIATQKRAGYRDLLEGRRILSSSVEGWEEEETYQTVTVRIEACAEDHDVDLGTGRRIEGRTVSGRFVEHWTFLRTRGATSPAKGLLEGSCPCCGAELSPTAPAACPRCGSWIRSGHHDWLLSEITQDGPSGGAPSGVVEPLRASDPAISRQTLEDQASWNFWRLVRAWNEARPDLVPAAADGAFQTDFVNKIPSTFGGRSLDPVVSSVDLLETRRDDQGDEAVVRVRWNPGPGMEGDRAVRHSPVLRMRRPSGSSTRAETALAAGHCPSCGGPEDNPFAIACSWCGAPSGSASKGWKIVAVSDSGDPSGL